MPGSASAWWRPLALRIVAALKRIAVATGTLSPEDQHIRDMWGDAGTPARLLSAVDDVRFQLGQSDRFREGLLRAGLWQAHIVDTLASLDMPLELAVLPHVESSFNAAAYSKAGAAGLWQFMRSTGRRYMRIDSAVDDRMDPFRATEAAAQLLSFNYRLLGTWPLALTAYNHGAEGMRRAKEAVGSDDIVMVLRNYHSPSFGFASRNYYVSFLAALTVDRNPEKYFGAIKREPAAKFQEVTLPGFVTVSALTHALHLSADELRRLNPALLPACWEGRRRVPQGYVLRLPLTGPTWTSDMLAARLSPADLQARQTVPERRKVMKGETLASIAGDYGMKPGELARLNGISARTRLRPGRFVRVPEATPVRVSVARVDHNADHTVADSATAPAASSAPQGAAAAGEAAALPGVLECAAPAVAANTSSARGRSGLHRAGCPDHAAGSGNGRREYCARGRRGHHDHRCRECGRRSRIERRGGAECGAGDQRRRGVPAGRAAGKRAGCARCRAGQTARGVPAGVRQTGRGHHAGAWAREYRGGRQCGRNGLLGGQR